MLFKFDGGLRYLYNLHAKQRRSGKTILHILWLTCSRQQSNHCFLRILMNECNMFCILFLVLLHNYSNMMTIFMCVHIIIIIQVSINYIEDCFIYPCFSTVWKATCFHQIYCGRFHLYQKRKYKNRTKLKDDTHTKQVVTSTDSPYLWF